MIAFSCVSHFHVIRVTVIESPYLQFLANFLNTRTFCLSFYAAAVNNVSITQLHEVALRSIKQISPCGKFGIGVADIDVGRCIGVAIWKHGDRIAYCARASCVRLIECQRIAFYIRTVDSRRDSLMSVVAVEAVAHLLLDGIFDGDAAFVVYYVIGVVILGCWCDTDIAGGSNLRIVTRLSPHTNSTTTAKGIPECAFCNSVSIALEYLETVGCSSCHHRPTVHIASRRRGETHVVSSCRTINRDALWIQIGIFPISSLANNTEGIGIADKGIL